MKKCGMYVVLAVTAGIFLSGCAGTQLESETVVQGTEIIDADGIVVGFSQVGAESDWRDANTESIKSSLSVENGFYLVYEDAQQKQEKQLKAIRNFILQEVDYIVLNPIVETGWDTVLQEAKDAGIPVIVGDRKVEVEDESLYTCWVGADTVAEGVNAGRWLENYLEEQGRADEEIYMVTLQGTLGSSAQIGRTEGFDKVLKEHENWKMLDMRDGDFTQAKGQEVMEGFLKEFPEIDVVICENDNMAFGAVDAIKKAGRTCGPDGEITIISFDAVSAAFDAMIDGEINVTFECNPMQGPEVKEIILDLEAGKEIEKIQYMEETYFDTTMDLEEIKKTRTY